MSEEAYCGPLAGLESESNHERGIVLTVAGTNKPKPTPTPTHAGARFCDEKHHCSPPHRNKSIACKSTSITDGHLGEKMNNTTTNGLRRFAAKRA